MIFQSFFNFKQTKNFTILNFSSSYCAFLDFFDIESRGAIVDEAPKAKVDSFSCFLMIRIFFSLQSTSLSILEQELVHSAAFFPLFIRTLFLPWLHYLLYFERLCLEIGLRQIINEKDLVSTSMFCSDKK